MSEFQTRKITDSAGEDGSVPDEVYALPIKPLSEPPELRPYVKLGAPVPALSVIFLV